MILSKHFMQIEGSYHAHNYTTGKGEEHHYTKQATCYDIAKAFGFDTAKYPKDFTGSTQLGREDGDYVAGVVTVKPTIKAGRSKRRTFVLCPNCLKEYTAGGIHQHMRDMHEGGAQRRAERRKYGSIAV